ncbi:MAG TPA: hypothetical protein VNM67_14195 [Thermoanaerobaculia bacterium]|jgi:hypothetical protein|nr:hypothetical protein [Thermoanaerobaculia bacterium]
MSEDPNTSGQKAAAKPRPRSKIEPERQHFRALVLSNPNYFGNLEASKLPPVKILKSITSFEQLVCAGLNPPADRLEAIIHVKQDAGYGGDICSTGTREYVRFYVDLHDNGVWHDVGLTSVRVHDIPGDKPLCYAVRLDFEPIRKLCTTQNIVKVRAILSWNAVPPANTPGFIPVYGNRVDVEVQIRPRFFFTVGDFLKELTLADVKIPDPLGPVVELLDPELQLKPLPLQTLGLEQKRKLYAEQKVPVHRFAFAESHKLLASADLDPGIFSGGGKSPLVNLGLSANELQGLLGFFQQATDGNTDFEELRCVGLRPGLDLLEGVLTVKKSSGYSGGLCTQGSTEYVAFWIDFGTGGGFTYMGTATVRVHDLSAIPAQGIQYAVFLKTDLSKHIVPCTAGPRVVRLRAILSWEAPPPPGNPNHVPIWGNREECLIQLRPGVVTGHIPVIETVGNMGIDDIDPATGLATGSGVGAAFTANESPFGGVIKITGRIGDPPDNFNGPAARFKYRIEVSRASVNDWKPLTNTIQVKISEFLNGVPQDCDPGPLLDFVCDVSLTPTDDGDGLGDGWYDYLDDYKGPWTRNLVQDQLASWSTDATMEGLWKIRITAKDMGTSPPTVFAGFQEVRVRIDNTAPTAALAITGATLNGNPIPAVNCGKFPVGTILTGTYEVHDPGTSSPNQHFGSLSLDVIPDGPANGAQVVPSARSFPVVPTTGEAGNWTLDTGATAMEPCGYVIRLVGCDRTIWQSGSVGLCAAEDVGFCLEEAPKP